MPDNFTPTSLSQDDFFKIGPWEWLLSKNVKFDHTSSFSGGSRDGRDDFYMDISPLRAEGGRWMIDEHICLRRRLTHFIQHSDGGSLIVSGYRGTGKSSLVKAAFKEFSYSEQSEDKIENPKGTRLEVNLSTVTTSGEVLALLIRRLIERFCPPGGGGKSAEWHDRLERLRLRLVAAENPSAQIRDAGSLSGLDYDMDSTASVLRESLAECQVALANLLKDIRHHVSRGLEAEKPLLIIYDELDKLVGEPPRLGVEQTRPNGLEVLERIAAELKLFFTESRCHHIFIAGKDADDRWEEDKGKGKGILESVFSGNFEVPSLFSVTLSEVGKQDSRKNDVPKMEKIQKALRALGLSPASLSYNTGVLILRRFSQKVVGRLAERVNLIETKIPKTWNDGEPDPTDHGAKASNSSKKTSTLLKKEANRYGVYASELEVRSLRTLIHYLTYKGRGIPRKILREFHASVSPLPEKRKENKRAGEVNESKSAGEVVVLRHELQRMTFYASIVEHLDQELHEFRSFSDKAKVSVFHIIDYILKFYETGFTRQDIEQANFMTTREELYPGRDVVGGLLRALEGRYIRIKDRRGSDYRLTPAVVVDLRQLHLRYGHEQMELRHTEGEFAAEIDRLSQKLDATSHQSTERRESTVTLLRLAQINENLGRLQEARLHYGRAMRWLRQDLQGFMEHRARVIGGERNPSTGSAGKNWGVGTGDGDLERAYGPTYTSYAMLVQLRMGHLEELVGRNRDALVFYHGAIAMHESLSRIPPAPKPEFPYGTALLSTFADGDGVREACRYKIKANSESGKDELWREGIGAPDFGEGIRFMPLHESEILLHGLSQAAIASEKIGDRASADHFMVRSLNFCDAISDELGSIEQAMLIGQVMMRRRDMRGACLWFLEAARRCKELTKAGDSRTGGWSTPGAEAGMKAQILIALGDIHFATHGSVFEYLAGYLKFVPPRGASQKRLRIGVWKMLEAAIGPLMPFEDQGDYCYYHAAILFESANDPLSTVKVCLRMLERRAERIAQCVKTADRAETEKKKREFRYEVLLNWRRFWGTANSMMMKLLYKDGLPKYGNPLPDQWGNIIRRRYMGHLLRLIGEVFTAMSLNVPEQREVSTRAFLRAFVEAEDKLARNPIVKAVNFYDELISKFKSSVKLKDYTDIHKIRVEELPSSPAETGTPVGYAGEDLDPMSTIIAAQKIIQAFAWISDRPDQAKMGEESGRVTEVLGPQSLLSSSQNYKSESENVSDTDLLGLNLKTHIFSKTETQKKCLEKNKRVNDLEMLILAEKSMLAGHLLYRDCPPDFGHARLCLRLADAYHSMLYVWLPEVAEREEKDIDLARNINQRARFFRQKAIEILARLAPDEPHSLLMTSEAHFNLGDQSLTTWAAGKNSDEGEGSGKKKTDGIKVRPLEFSPTDLVSQRREAIYHYKEGLRCLLRELELHAERYPMPGSVCYANRNVFDSETEFRIAVAVHARHRRFVGDDTKERTFKNAAESEKLVHLQSELARLANRPNTPHASDELWLPNAKRLLDFVNDVRTDRGPLKIKVIAGTYMVLWTPHQDLPQSHTVVLFEEETKPNGRERNRRVSRKITKPRASRKAAKKAK